MENKKIGIDNSSINKKHKIKNTSYLALGLCLGCSLGVIFKNIPIFVGSGIVIGAIMDGMID